MSGVWNIIHPPRITYRSTIKNLLHSGQELFGTVVQHGKNSKTVKVRVTYKWWYSPFKAYMGGASTFMVHDEEDYCTTGDKVVIKHTRKLTKNKYYYIRNIVIPYPREDYYKDPKHDQLMDELQQIRKELMEKKSSL